MVAPRPTSNNSRSFPASTSVAAPNRSGTGNGVPVPSSVTLKSCAHAADVKARQADKIAKRRMMPMSRLHACAGEASLSSNSLRRKVPRHERRVHRDALLRSASLRLAVLQHLHLFQRDEAARNHAVEHRQEGVDLLLRVDDLDHDRQVLRQAQDFGGVDVARMAKAHRTAQDRGAGELHLAGFDQNRLVERQAPRLGVFSYEDSEQDGVTRKLHGSHPSHRIEAEGGDMAEPNREQAQYHRAANIEGGLQPFAIAHEIERLQTERGKRRVPAAEADHHELPPGSADENTSVGTGQRGEESDDEGTDDVDD